jgi:RNA polymerase sigma-70 factor (ECF subfamily)
MFLRRKIGSSATDEDLVAAVRDGHQPALGTLWDRYAQLLFGVCMKYLKDTERSKDLVAELFADLPALLGRHTVERFRPWVHTVMRNRCLLFLRNHRPADAQALDQLENGADDTDESALREADLTRLEQAIERLNDAQRTCIRLFHLEHHSYQETAARTGLTVEQVRSHLQNGRRNLRLILAHHHADTDHP